MSDSANQVQYVKGKPLVSICCITYNHEPYIRDCLEGFMMQKTNFPFEVLIHDDASTDHTADIIREYEAKYPDIIKPIYQTENQYSKGISISATYNYSRAQGKYIAMCEGDDRWIDSNKLQQQVDYLEAHPDCSLCCHSVAGIVANGSRNGLFLLCQKKIYSEYGKMKTQTSSFVCRNIPIIVSAFRDCGKDIVGGDEFLKGILYQYGYFYAFDTVMSEYRIHAEGITHSKKWQQRSWAKQWGATMKYAPKLTKYCKQILVNSLWEKIIFPRNYHKKIDFETIFQNISITDFLGYSCLFFICKMKNLVRMIFHTCAAPQNLDNLNKCKNDVF